MAGERKNLTCCMCKQKFPRETIIYYGAQNNQLKYCPDCYKEKRKREIFSEYIRELFGLISPGPKIYSQRKKLHEEYGFTDETIIKTLDYLFKVKNYDRTYESIGLVTPKTVEEADQYYKKKEEEMRKIQELEQIKITRITPNKQLQPKKRKIDLIDLDDYLED